MPHSRYKKTPDIRPEFFRICRGLFASPIHVRQDMPREHISPNRKCSGGGCMLIQQCFHALNSPSRGRNTRAFTVRREGIKKKDGF